MCLAVSFLKDSCASICFQNSAEEIRRKACFETFALKMSFRSMDELVIHDVSDARVKTYVIHMSNARVKASFK